MYWVKTIVSPRVGAQYQAPYVAAARVPGCKYLTGHRPPWGHGARDSRASMGPWERHENPDPGRGIQGSRADIAYLIEYDNDVDT